MLDTIAARMAKEAGIRPVADFGEVHAGKVGHTDCTVLAGLESWSGCEFMRITVVHTRGRTSRRTRVIKWPYAKGDPRALGPVLRDLDTFLDAPKTGILTDDRGAVGCFFDRLTRTDYLGRYDFISPIDEPYENSVDGTVVRFSDQTEATLTARRPGRGFIFGQMPLAAIGEVAKALRAYQQG